MIKKMKSKKEIEEFVRDFMESKAISEEHLIKPIRVWGKSKWGNKIIILITFKTFPPSIHEFNSYLVVVYAYLLANATRLGISTENVASLTLLYVTGTVPLPSWEAIWANYIHPLLVNNPVRNKLSVCRHNIEQLLLTIFNDIPKSVWTADDRTVLRRPLKSTSHIAAQIMGVGATLTLADLMTSGIKIHLHNPLTPDTDEMPEYNHIDLEMYVGLPNLDPATLDYSHVADVTRALFLIGFPPAQSGMTAYIRGVYVNSTGKRSTFYSNVLIQIIP